MTREEEPLAKIEVFCDGMVVEHNMPCAVCGKKRAVYQANFGIFLPCWQCQKEGYRLIITYHKKWMAFFEWFGLFRKI